MAKIEGLCPHCEEWFEVEWTNVLPPGGYWWKDNRNGGCCPGCDSVVLVESECEFRYEWTCFHFRCNNKFMRDKDPNWGKEPYFCEECRAKLYQFQEEK